MVNENLRRKIEIIIRHYENDAKKRMDETQLIRYADMMYSLLKEVVKNV